MSNLTQDDIDKLLEAQMVTSAVHVKLTKPITKQFLFCSNCKMSSANSNGKSCRNCFTNQNSTFQMAPKRIFKVEELKDAIVLPLNKKS